MSNGNLPCGLRIRRDKGIRTYFGVQGPWNIGDPVHELITLKALQDAGIATGGDYENPATWEKMRGVIWNDDPECLFFDDNDNRSNDWSDGIAFLRAYSTYSTAAQGGAFFGAGSPLLARSHFGDLQCLHAMAARDNLDPATTLNEIFEWCELFYTIAAGRIDKSLPVVAALRGKMEKWFPGSSITVGNLFKAGQIGNIRDRALGALLHTVQDSYSRSHANRNAHGEIEQFYCYTHQNADMHKECDTLPPGGLPALQGASDAIQASSTIVKYANQLRPWPGVIEFLKERVFKLSPTARTSGPGEFTRESTLFAADLGSQVCEFNYAITGTIKDDDGPFDHDEYGYPNWGAPRLITSDGFQLRVDHSIVVDDEVEVRCWLTFSMRSDLTLCVTGTFEIFEGYADHREWKDSKTLDKTISRNGFITEKIRLDTKDGGYADLDVTITNMGWT